MDWQTPAALGVVLLTLVLFFVNRKKKSCDGGNCSCPAAKSASKKPGEITLEREHRRF